MKRVLPLLFPFLLSIGCEKEIVSDLNHAENLLFSHPDSALTILRRIDKSQLNTPKVEAEYSLLMSAALDKNYIDICSDSLISKAVDYYSIYGSHKDKMLSWYYQGVCLKNAGEQIPAMLAFEKAEREAEHLDEWLYLGLVYRNKATLFSMTNNNISAIENRIKAITCFRKANASVFKAYAELSLAIDYSNVKDYDKADSLINLLRTMYPDNVNLLYHSYLREAGILVKKEIEPQKAIDLFRLVPIRMFGVLDFGYLAQAFEMIGATDSSDCWLSEGYRRFHDNNEVASLDYLRAYIESNRGHFREAFNLIDHAASVQDSLTRVLLQQSVSSAQRDYYKSESLLWEEKNRHMRERTIFGIMFGLVLISLLAITVVSRFRKKDRLLQDQMARLTLQERELDRINRDNAHLIGSLFSEKIDHLDMLCETYFKSEDNGLKEQIFKQVKTSSAKIRNDNDLFLSLEKDLDRYCKGIMTKLRAQVPRIKGENLRIIMLFFAGFSYELVFIILGKNSIESLRTTRSRFRKEISDANAPDREFFLKMLETKKRSQAGTNGNSQVC